MSRKLLACLAPGILLLTCRLVVAAENSNYDEQTLRQAGVEVDGNAVLQQLRKRVPTDSGNQKARAHIKQLANEDFTEREEASAALVAMGTPYRPLLLQAARDPDPEVSHRARLCLEQIGQVNETPLLEACTRILARRAPMGAAEVLLDFAPIADEPTLIDEVAGALTRVGVKEGQAQPLLFTALTDPIPMKRALAGEALVRGGVQTQRAAVRRLLQDPESVVRERVALALLDAHDREAVPALIRLLGELGPLQRMQVEDALNRLAGEHVPTLVAGETPDEQRRRVDSWKTWWQERGADVDLDHYDPKGPLGYTLLCMMDNRIPQMGKVVELDSAGQARWQIEGLRYPIDAQVLGRDRILIAEYMAAQVSERNFHGDVLWKYDATSFVLSARRQPNGTIVVTTREEVIDLDRQGREVSRIKLGQGRLAAAGLRLPNGQTAVVTLTGHFTLYDATGQVVRTFNLGARLYPAGCTMDVLPNGNVLVPLTTGSIVEVDMTGKVVWQVESTCPMAVQRLPNGNNLVTSRIANAITEIDKDGKVITILTAPGRVQRALRR